MADIGSANGSSGGRPTGGVYRVADNQRRSQPFKNPLEFSPEGKEYGLFPVDVTTADGFPLAKAGERLSPDFLQRLDNSRTAVDEMRTPFKKTQLFKDLKVLLGHPIYAGFFGNIRKRHEILSLLGEAKVPSSLLAEMGLLKRSAPWAYDQALASATLGMLLVKYRISNEDILRETFVAFALRDIGLTRIDSRILRNVTKMSPEQYHNYMSHEIIAAALLARVMGSSLATRIAIRHHRISPPERWVPYAAGYKADQIDLILSSLVVADAFIGMVSPRSFRISTYNTKGAMQALVEGAKAGRFDSDAVKIFVTYCNENFDPKELEAAKGETGRQPAQNEYGVAN